MFSAEPSVGQSGSQSGLSGPSEDSGAAHLPSDIGDTETELSQWRASEETGHSDNSYIRQLLSVCDLQLC